LTVRPIIPGTELIPIASLPALYNPRDLALIRRTVASDTTDDEFALFIHWARGLRLDPLRRRMPRSSGTVALSCKRYSRQERPLGCGHQLDLPAPEAFKDFFVAQLLNHQDCVRPQGRTSSFEAPQSGFSIGFHQCLSSNLRIRSSCSTVSIARRRNSITPATAFASCKITAYFVSAGKATISTFTFDVLWRKTLFIQS
jgi:hypothetical protein